MERIKEESLFVLSVCFQIEGDRIMLVFGSTLNAELCLILKNNLRLRVAVLLVLLGQNEQFFNFKNVNVIFP